MEPTWTSGVPRGRGLRGSLCVKKGWVGFLDQIWTTAGQLTTTQD